MRLHLRVLENDRPRTSWIQLYNKYSRSEQKDATALYWAAFFDLRQTVSLLCNSKSSQEINKVGGFHDTALKAAASRNNEKVVEILIASGADVNFKRGFSGTALQAAALLRNTKIVDVLIANGADVNCKGIFHGTALQAAAYQGHDTIVDMLIANGADVGCYEDDGVPLSLFSAASYGYSSIVSKLLKADVDERTFIFKGKYGTALDQAAHKGYGQIVEELLQAGADRGHAMEIATQEGHEGVVRILIKHGAVYQPAEEV